MVCLTASQIFSSSKQIKYPFVISAKYNWDITTLTKDPPIYSWSLLHKIYNKYDLHRFWEEIDK